ncbi:hypothetical protein ElyMa_004854800 [Elysia marginata]|uniref:Uncharacterized protein n=1 Tax=Elysia marginata TaxID=1093978 RepID=A0AAV4IUQ5_9GAST|nr:hypothetical protein ElyMa_004854800 [Elysia marginata]
MFASHLAKCESLSDEISRGDDQGVQINTGGGAQCLDRVLDADITTLCFPSPKSQQDFVSIQGTEGSLGIGPHVVFNSASVIASSFRRCSTRVSGGADTLLSQRGGNNITSAVQKDRKPDAQPLRVPSFSEIETENRTEPDLGKVSRAGSDVSSCGVTDSDSGFGPGTAQIRSQIREAGCPSSELDNSPTTASGEGISFQSDSFSQGRYSAFSCVNSRTRESAISRAHSIETDTHSFYPRRGNSYPHQHIDTARGHGLTRASTIETDSHVYNSRTDRYRPGNFDTGSGCVIRNADTFETVAHVHSHDSGLNRSDCIDISPEGDIDGRDPSLAVLDSNPCRAQCSSRGEGLEAQENGENGDYFHTRPFPLPPSCEIGNSAKGGAIARANTIETDACYNNGCIGRFRSNASDISPVHNIVRATTIEGDRYPSKSPVPRDFAQFRPIDVDPEVKPCDETASRESPRNAQLEGLPTQSPAVKPSSTSDVLSEGSDYSSDPDLDKDRCSGPQTTGPGPDLDKDCCSGPQTTGPGAPRRGFKGTGSLTRSRAVVEDDDDDDDDNSLPVKDFGPTKTSPTSSATGTPLTGLQTETTVTGFTYLKNSSPPTRFTPTTSSNRNTIPANTVHQADSYNRYEDKHPRKSSGDIESCTADQSFQYGISSIPPPYNQTCGENESGFSICDSYPSIARTPGQHADRNTNTQESATRVHPNPRGTRLVEHFPPGNTASLEDTQANNPNPRGTRLVEHFPTGNTASLEDTQANARRVESEPVDRASYDNSSSSVSENSAEQKSSTGPDSKYNQERAPRNTSPTGEHCRSPDQQRGTNKPSPHRKESESLSLNQQSPPLGVTASVHTQNRDWDIPLKTTSNRRGIESQTWKREASIGSSKVSEQSQLSQCGALAQRDAGDYRHRQDNLPRAFSAETQKLISVLDQSFGSGINRKETNHSFDSLDGTAGVSRAPVAPARPKARRQDTRDTGYSSSSQDSGERKTTARRSFSHERPLSYRSDSVPSGGRGLSSRTLASRFEDSGLNNRDRQFLSSAGAKTGADLPRDTPSHGQNGDQIGQRSSPRRGDYPFGHNTAYPSGPEVAHRRHDPRYQRSKSSGRESLPRQLPSYSSSRRLGQINASFDLPPSSDSRWRMRDRSDSGSASAGPAGPSSAERVHRGAYSFDRSGSQGSSAHSGSQGSSAHSGSRGSSAHSGHFKPSSQVTVEESLSDRHRSHWTMKPEGRSVRSLKTEALVHQNSATSTHSGGLDTDHSDDTQGKYPIIIITIIIIIILILIIIIIIIIIIVSITIPIDIISLSPPSPLLSSST